MGYDFTMNFILIIFLPLTFAAENGAPQEISQKGGRFGWVKIPKPTLPLKGVFPFSEKGEATVVHNVEEEKVVPEEPEAENPTGLEEATEGVFGKSWLNGIWGSGKNSPNDAGSMQIPEDWNGHQMESEESSEENSEGASPDGRFGWFKRPKLPPVNFKFSWPEYPGGNDTEIYDESNGTDSNNNPSTGFFSKFKKPNFPWGTTDGNGTSDTNATVYRELYNRYKNQFPILMDITIMYVRGYPMPMIALMIVQKHPEVIKNLSLFTALCQYEALKKMWFVGPACVVIDNHMDKMIQFIVENKKKIDMAKGNYEKLAPIMKVMAKMAV